MPSAAQQPARRPRVCVIAPSHLTIQNLYRGRFEYFQQGGFDVTVVCGAPPDPERITQRGVHLHVAPLARSYTRVFTHLRCLFHLYRYLKRERFDLVETSTPQAGFLATIAGRWAGVRQRVHILLGLPYELHRGVLATATRWITRVACRGSHHVIAIAHSLREQAIADGMCEADTIEVINLGSPGGIDTGRFSPDDGSRRAATRQAWDIPAAATVIGFCGRLRRAKGIGELVDAYDRLRRDHPDLYLLIVGDYEDIDRPPQRIIDRIQQDEQIVHAGWQADPVPFFAAMDIFALPTYREGFGAVLIEAAGMGIPVVSSDVIGVRDAVGVGRSGYLAPPRDVDALTEQLRRLLSDPSLRERMAQTAREFAREFDQVKLWEGWVAAYRRYLAEMRDT